jgi:hypothetical protein
VKRRRQFPAVTRELLRFNEFGSLAAIHCSHPDSRAADLTRAVLHELRIWSTDGGFDVALSLSLDGCDPRSLP